MFVFPNEIIYQIGKHLDYYSLVALSSTCKDYYYLFEEMRKDKIEYINWKIIVHTIFKNNKFYVDRSWVVLGNRSHLFPNEFEDLYSESCPLCEDAENMEYSDRVYYHGFEIVKQIDINTFVFKGVGGKILNDMIDNYYITDDEFVIPLTFDVKRNLDIGYVVKDCSYDFSEAHLEILNLDVNKRLDYGISKYSLMGLYVSPITYSY